MDTESTILTPCGSDCDRQHDVNEDHNTNQEPTLARRILDLPDEATQVFMGLVASHFATTGAIDRETAAKYVDEALAVTK